MVFAVVLLNVRWDMTLRCRARTSQLFFMDSLTTTILENVRKYSHHDSRLESVVLVSRKIWGSHSGIAEDSSILGCATVSLGRLFLMFLRVIMPSSSWSNSPVLAVPDADNDVLCCRTGTARCFEGTLVPQDVATCLFSNMPSHPSSFESSAALLW